MWSTVARTGFNILQAARCPAHSCHMTTGDSVQPDDLAVVLQCMVSPWYASIAMIPAKSVRYDLDTSEVPPCACSMRRQWRHCSVNELHIIKSINAWDPIAGHQFTGS